MLLLEAFLMLVEQYERGPTNAFFGEVQETIYDDTNNWTVLEGSKLRDAEKEWSWFEPQEGSAFVVGDQVCFAQFVLKNFYCHFFGNFTRLSIFQTINHYNILIESIIL